jgi:uncharacterized protein YciI
MAGHPTSPVPRRAGGLAAGAAVAELGGMYALAIIRYRRPLDAVLAVQDEHRAYLRTLKERGLLLASGPFDPRSGGALLLRIPEGADVGATLDRVRDDDPFTRKGIAQYELLPWAPTIGVEELGRL